MKKPITSDSITKSKKVSKVRTNPDPSATFAYRQIPISLAMVNNMADDLLVYHKTNPETITISDFWNDRGIARSTYYDLLDRHPHLKAAHQVALSRLADRMINVSFKSQGNWNVAKHVIHAYGEDYRKYDEHHSNLKQDQTVAMGIQLVQLPSVEKTKELDDHLNKGSK